MFNLKFLIMRRRRRRGGYRRYGRRSRTRRSYRLSRGGIRL